MHKRGKVLLPMMQHAAYPHTHAHPTLFLFLILFLNLVHAILFSFNQVFILLYYIIILFVIPFHLTNITILLFFFSLYFHHFYYSLSHQICYYLIIYKVYQIRDSNKSYSILLPYLLLLFSSNVSSKTILTFFL